MANVVGWYGLELEVSCFWKAWECVRYPDGALCSLTQHKSDITFYAPTDPWTLITQVSYDYVDVMTRDKKYCLSLTIREHEFPKYYYFLASQSYRMCWFNAYQVKGKVLINVMWVAGGLKILSDEQLDENTADRRLDGYEPVHINWYFSCTQLGDICHYETSETSCLSSDFMWSGGQCDGIWFVI